MERLMLDTASIPALAEEVVKRLNNGEHVLVVSYNPIFNDPHDKPSNPNLTVRESYPVGGSYMRSWLKDHPAGLVIAYIGGDKYGWSDFFVSKGHPHVAFTCKCFAQVTKSRLEARGVRIICTGCHDSSDVLRLLQLLDFPS